MRILIDAMGGDNAPNAIVQGAIDAAKEFGVQIVLVGRGEAILNSLKDLGLDTSDKGIKELVDCMMVVWGKRPEAHWPIIYDALQRIKE